MQKTKLQIIDETFEAYKDASNRAVVQVENAAIDGSRYINNVCVYKNEDTGKMCAVGRCETNPDPTLRMGLADRFGTWTPDGVGPMAWVDGKFFYDEETMNGGLKEEYRGHAIEFWIELQSLHDYEDYFVDGTWSPAGLRRIAQMKQIYAED